MAIRDWDRGQPKIILAWSDFLAAESLVVSGRVCLIGKSEASEGATEV